MQDIDDPAVVLMRTERGGYCDSPIPNPSEPAMSIEDLLDVRELQRGRVTEERLAGLQDAEVQAQMEAFFASERPPAFFTEAYRDPELHPPQSEVRSLLHRSRPVLLDVEHVMDRDTPPITGKPKAWQGVRLANAVAPCHKMPYHNKTAARTMLNHRERRGAVRLRAYECDRCGYWHISSKPLRASQEHKYTRPRKKRRR
jgi:hypothetical protein